MVRAFYVSSFGFAYRHSSSLSRALSLVAIGSSGSNIASNSEKKAEFSTTKCGVMVTFGHRFGRMSVFLLFYAHWTIFGKRVNHNI